MCAGGATCVPRYYNLWVSLFGTLLCVIVMFLMDHITVQDSTVMCSVQYSV